MEKVTRKLIKIEFHFFNREDDPVIVKIRSGLGLPIDARVNVLYSNIFARVWEAIFKL